MHPNDHTSLGRPIWNRKNPFINQEKYFENQYAFSITFVQGFDLPVLGLICVEMSRKASGDMKLSVPT